MHIVNALPDQENWPNDYCQNGMMQSPINIDTHDTIRVNDWDPLYLIRWDEYPRNMTLANTGHMAILEQTTRDCKSQPMVKLLTNN